MRIRKSLIPKVLSIAIAIFATLGPDGPWNSVVWTPKKEAIVESVDVGIEINVGVPFASSVDDGPLDVHGTRPLIPLALLLW